MWMWPTGLTARPLGGLSREGSACGNPGESADRSERRGQGQASWSPRCVPAVRSGFLHLADALAFRGDVEVVTSTIRALVATLKSGEKCGVEPELVGKGAWGPGLARPSPARRAVPCGSTSPRPGSAVGSRACDGFTPGADRLTPGLPTPPLLPAQGWACEALLAQGAGCCLSRSQAV